MSGRRAAVFTAVAGLAAWSLAAAPAAGRDLIRSFDSGGLEARSAALILSGQEGGALPITLRPLPEEAVGGELPFVVEIDGRALLEQDADEILAEVHAYLVTDSGRLLGFATRALRFDAAAARALGDGWSGIRYLGRLPLGEGVALPETPVSLRVLVLQRAEDRFGLRMAAVESATAGGDPAALAESVPDGWWLAGSDGVVAEDRLFRVDLPDPGWDRPDAEALQAEIVLPTHDPDRQRKLRRAEMDALRLEYWRALRSLAGGLREQAAADVVAFEEAKIADGARERDLARGQMEAAEELAKIEPESVPPLVRLHLDLYAHHLDRRQYLLSTHSRRMAEVLLEVYVKNSRSPDTGAVAAGALVEMARHLLDRGNEFEAWKLLVRAVEHQPDNRTALLTLTAVTEMLGEYELAVDTAKKLTDALPEEAEGWLRLGVNLRRIKRDRAARESFERALKVTAAPQWVSQLAFEELARLHLDEGDPRAAMALLNRALERFPDGERLHIQAAAASTRMGAIQDARQQLNTLDRLIAVGNGGTAGGGSPRLRYDQWPDAAFEASWEAFTERAAERHDRLVRALAQVAPATGPGAGGQARGGGR